MTTTITRTEGVIDGLDAITWTLTIDSEPVAYLAAHTTGLILNVEVQESHRGEGHARALYTHAATEHGLLHVPAWGRTEDGERFAQAVGGDVMDDEQAAQILDVDLSYLDVA